ncbi:Voltage-dependent calcium channel subunit alpha-2/delta-4 [Papilio xuthus]|uniref:Voltage-dependent calcium channel subunit alpha-2/delta-4 n=1 Tax=Papilio xuthus TaxID=66420 RepID=A0A194PPZ3_PAPXU|nr:Voltage-dependent calcium channel subunit alpha-2/delta-4 [Papilio xuthus]
MRCVGFVLVFTFFVLSEITTAWRADVVKLWATDLGEDLWKLSESLTKSDQIRIKYKQMNASVKKKDGKQILESSLRSVSTMLTRKINAVKCIHRTAERLAREFNYSLVNEHYMFKYCSAKYSEFYKEGETEPIVPSQIPIFAENKTHYMKISLEKDSHFYDINVNTNLSCIHVPTNIYFKEHEALKAILWSKDLNDIFINNYKSDPSLSWQYFGSSSGIMRFYPGMPWNMEKIDTYDCRVQSWYIEAATCSKDVIILFDVSGSMTGFKNYVARSTLKSLLDTLSNNDYVNVFTFKKDVSQVVKCFDGLVQATLENKKTITNTLEPIEGEKKHNVPLEGNANLTMAYITAFTTLKERRQHCNVTSTQGCNQLVMVITDYVPGNLTEVFEEHNREVVDGKTYIPVRVFTYLIGKEVTNVREIQWMACLNRGYFVHIHSVEEVQQQVLKYINVIARPMILEGREPPPTWTHAAIDYTRTSEWNVSIDAKEPDEDKLVTSVAIPAFDYKYNEDHNDARLLGVAGTDVPIDSIAKLAQPHQLGVNGYSFIVSNNGYLLLHPLLITSINGNLQTNYNSVDFVEVEQVDDGKGPRELGDEIKSLREHLVNGDEGKQTEVKVLFHYDNMRRIARVKHDYFFNKLVGTPFSMGISLPGGYGDTELLLKDNPLEAKQGLEVTGINVTSYFNFSYRVHPDWVYCKYHYLEGHESENSEIEMYKFLVNISKNELNITKKQYREETESSNFDFEKHCGDEREQLGKDDYYCNEDLVKQLVFDAKLTTPYFATWYATSEERKLANEYKVNVRFIATSSGLTRWHYINDDSKNEKVTEQGEKSRTFDGQVFGDLYPKAIEETWYKAAVLQHLINAESLVVATNLPVLDKTIINKPKVANNDGDITITASYAIFYKDGNSETPASVVGVQFVYSGFYKKFLEITNTTTEFSCTDQKYDCYVIDSSGYVVLAHDKDDVGRFFGVIHPHVLQSFMDKNIYEHVDVFNYQALCPLSALPDIPSNAWIFSTPFNSITNLIRWLTAELFLILFDVVNWQRNVYVAGQDEGTTIPPVEDEIEGSKNKDDDSLFSCDHRISLYILNQSYFLDSIGPSPAVVEDEEGECHPPYWAALVTKTNLLLVVVERGPWHFKDTCEKPPDTEPVATSNSTTNWAPCHKLELGQLPRRRLEDCFTYHDKERNITACGIGSRVRVDPPAFVLSATMAFFTTAMLLR